jgi:two-component system, chemotaxis family, response regulator Rcp1
VLVLNAPLDINLLPVPAMPSPRTIRLLVVEDDEAYLYLIKKAFSVPTEKTRWELTVATDGQEALDLLFKNENGDAALPDLILLDWKLPKVNGDEVLRQVKQHEKLRKMPVLVFSSSQADKDIHEAYGGHANGYITKPADINMLSKIVEAIEQFWIAVAQIPKVVR